MGHPSWHITIKHSQTATRKLIPKLLGTQEDVGKSAIECSPGSLYSWQGMVSSIIRTIFAQNDQASAKEQLRHVVDELKDRAPKAMEILEEAEGYILAFIYGFPA